MIPMREKKTRDGVEAVQPMKLYSWGHERNKRIPVLSEIDFEPQMLRPYLGTDIWAIIRPGHCADLLDSVFASRLKAFEVMLDHLNRNVYSQNNDEDWKSFRRWVEREIEMENLNLIGHDKANYSEASFMNSYR